MSATILCGDASARRAMGSHQSARADNDEWLTPPALLALLGDFDLDPCAPVERPWATAAEHFTRFDDGLNRRWRGRVWLNPPYGTAEQWLQRLADHGNGIALIFARTETAMFFRCVWERAEALLFLRGRLHFHFVNGQRAKANAGAPSVLVAYGARNVTVLRDLDLGAYVELTHRRLSKVTMGLPLEAAA